MVYFSIHVFGRSNRSPDYLSTFVVFATLYFSQVCIQIVKVKKILQQDDSLHSFYIVAQHNVEVFFLIQNELNQFKYLIHNMCEP